MTELTLDEAALAVGLAPNTLRRHVYRNQTLKPSQYRPLMFDPESLGQWNEQRLATIRQAQGSPERRHPWYGQRW